MKNIFIGLLFFVSLSFGAKSEALAFKKSEAEAVGKASKIWTVSKTSELLSAMKNSVGGDTIICLPGSYTQLDASYITKLSKVVIMAANRNDPPKFTDNPSMILYRLTHFSFEGLFFDGTGHVDSYGYPAGTGIKYAFLTDVTFRNCTMDFWHVGLAPVSGIPAITNTNIVFEYNKFTRRGMDVFRIYTSHIGLVIRNNLFENDYIDVTRSTIDIRHPDIIQFATGGSYVGSKNVVVEYNKCILLDSYSHCFYFQNERITKNGETDENIYHHSITVHGNDIFAPHINAIAFGGCKGVNVNGNRIRISPPDTYNHSAGTPMINFYRFCDGVVTNNAMPAAVHAQETGALATINHTGNIYPTATQLPMGWINIDNKVGPYAYENGGNPVSVNSIKEGTHEKEIRSIEIFPNPVTSMARINFSVSKTGQLDISIYNISGKRMETLANKPYLPGNYSIEWQPKNLPDGIFFCRFTTNSYSESQMITRINK